MDRFSGAALVGSLLLCAQPAAADDPADRAWLETLSHDLKGTGRKLVALANAVPAARFGWSPSPEVRTVSKVYMHVVATNLLILPGLGADPPPGVEIPDSSYGLSQLGFQRETEVTSKTEVLGALEESFTYATEAILDIQDLDERVAIYGFPGSKRDYLLLIVSHAQEHLGQSIAYARSIGVTPPWSVRPDRPSPDSTAEIDGQTARGTIRGTDQFGNLVVSLVDTDMEQIGVEKGDFVAVEACQGTERLFVGGEIFDVRPGEWILYPSPNGYWSIALSFGSAAQSLGCEGNEPIAVRPAQ